MNHLEYQKYIERLPLALRLANFNINGELPINPNNPSYQKVSNRDFVTDERKFYK